MPVYSYAWASGWDVALLSLTNVETDLKAYTFGRLIAPTSDPVDLFPVRSRLGTGRIRGDGQVNHDWALPILPIAALHHIISTKLTTTGSMVDSKQVTIYTPQHELEQYARFNAWLTLPQPKVDYHVRRGFVYDLVLHFTDLIALA